MLLCEYGGTFMNLKIKKINKYFGEVHVLQDVSFDVASGQIFGFLGRNGAGKTTAMRIVMDVFKATTGEIYINDQLFNPSKFKIGYLPEERGMYSKSTVKDQLLYFSMLRGAEKKDALKSLTYWTKKFEIDQYLNQKLETLSKGNQQKVQITQAFLNEPDILILDEPFSGLDPVNSKVFQDALVEYIDEDKIIIFSSHQMAYVESFCDQIAIIDKGAIVLNGSLKEIKKVEGHGKLRIKTLEPNKLFELTERLDIEVEERNSDYILKLPIQLNAQEFLRTCFKESLDISAFAPYEPSLQEIFIQKVGKAV